MSISYQAKSSPVLGRQLSVQEVTVSCNAVAGTSDAAGFVSVANGTIGATVVTADIGEAIEKCYSAEVRERATGAIVASAAAPSIAVANKISVTFDGTAQTDLTITFKYKVQE
jgi:hypothetical protein